MDRQAWSARRDLKEKPGVSDDSHISMKPKTPRTELVYFCIPHHSSQLPERIQFKFDSLIYLLRVFVRCQVSEVQSQHLLHKNSNWRRFLCILFDCSSFFKHILLFQIFKSLFGFPVVFFHKDDVGSDITDYVEKVKQNEIHL